MYIKRFTQSLGNSSLEEIAQLNEKLKTDLREAKYRPSLKRYRGEHPDYVLKEETKDDLEVDPKHEKEFSNLISVVEERRSNLNTERKYPPVQPTILDSSIEFDHPIIEAEIGSTVVHQKLNSYRNNPIFEELESTKPLDEDTSISKVENPYKVSEFLFVWLPAEGFVRNVDVDISLLPPPVQQIVKKKPKKLIKRSSIILRVETASSHEYSVIVEDKGQLRISTNKPKIRTGSMLQMRHATPKSLKEVRVKGSEGKRKSYSRMRESTEMISVKDFIKQKLFNYSRI